ncbi:MAG: GNAT family N-acetyltransferase [Planctomycetota bacterium]|nr:GNAT family N-acetyltransferase [Planctomycetota bacterium]
MQVTRISTTDELQPCSAAWNCLTRGVPFRSWEWLSTWWEHYGSGRELYVLAVRDDFGTLVGVLPLFRERNAARGRVLQLLGSGEVCTDYLTVLSTNEHEDLVIEALAKWLIDACGSTANHADLWDLLELDGVLTSDAAMGKLVGTLCEAGCGVHRKPGLNCWKMSLPAAWDELYEGLSKNRRKAFRRLQRDAIDSGKLVFQTATTDDEFHAAMKLFADLHQKRRISLGEPGCFTSPRFAAFIDAVSKQLWAAGTLELCWIELDGRPVGIEYCLLDTNTTYVYQGGIDPEAQQASPGHLMTMALIRHSIASSRTTYDFLRGDEPYKTDWNAQPQETVKLRISANRTAAHLRQGVWLAGATMKKWVKGGLSLTGMP